MGKPYRPSNGTEGHGFIAIDEDEERAMFESPSALLARATRAESELAAMKLRLIDDCDAARDFPANTCGASRHAQMIAEALIAGVPYEMLTDDPAYCGQSILSAVKSLFTARTELAALRKRVEDAPVALVDRWAGGVWVLHKADLGAVCEPLRGKRVRLVVEG